MAVPPKGDGLEPCQRVGQALVGELAVADHKPATGDQGADYARQTGVDRSPRDERGRQPGEAERVPVLERGDVLVADLDPVGHASRVNRAPSELQGPREHVEANHPQTGEGLPVGDGHRGGEPVGNFRPWRRTPVH
jgi:hypothetical protein